MNYLEALKIIQEQGAEAIPKIHRQHLLRALHRGHAEITEYRQNRVDGTLTLNAFDLHLTEKGYAFMSDLKAATA